MPKQIKKQCTRGDVDLYHEDLLYVISLPGRWPNHDILIQEFLDQDVDTEAEPSEFADFREAWDTARYSGMQAGLKQELSVFELRMLARKIYASDARRRYYRRIVNGKIRCASSEEVEPISAVELEQRYQHYLYKKEREFQGLGNGPRFKKWLEEPDCPAKRPFAKPQAED